MRPLLAVVSAFLLVLQPSAPPPPQTPSPAPAQVMILGVTHFAVSGDAVQGVKRDILGEEAQAQIQAVTTALERFTPDRIVVEHPATDQAELDRMYQDHRNGRRSAYKNEIDQLAFRLAQRLHHDRVHAFDHSSVMDFASLMQCAQETGRPELIAAFQQRIGQITEWSNDLTAHSTIGEELAILNDPRYQDAGHRLYMDLLDFDTAERQPALALLTVWYERNLKMHATLRRTARPGERILVIVGAAHVKHLRDFASQDPSMTPIDPAAFLPEVPEDPIQKFLAIASSVQ